MRGSPDPALALTEGLPSKTANAPYHVRADLPQLSIGRICNPARLGHPGICDALPSHARASTSVRQPLYVHPPHVSSRPKPRDLLFLAPLYRQPHPRHAELSRSTPVNRKKAPKHVILDQIGDLGNEVLPQRQWSWIPAFAGMTNLGTWVYRESRSRYLRTFREQDSRKTGVGTFSFYYSSFGTKSSPKAYSPLHSYLLSCFENFVLS